MIDYSQKPDIGARVAEQQRSEVRSPKLEKIPKSGL
jgi:hypothetical protein